jgi:hypothetical protein
MDLLVGNDSNSSANSASRGRGGGTSVDVAAAVVETAVDALADAKVEDGVVTMVTVPPANCVARRATQFFTATRGLMPHSPVSPITSLRPLQQQTTASTPTGTWTSVRLTTSLENLTS